MRVSQTYQTVYNRVSMVANFFSPTFFTFLIERSLLASVEHVQETGQRFQMIVIQYAGVILQYAVQLAQGGNWKM